MGLHYIFVFNRRFVQVLTILKKINESLGLILALLKTAQLISYTKDAKETKNAEDALSEKDIIKILGGVAHIPHTALWGEGLCSLYDSVCP